MIEIYLLDRNVSYHNAYLFIRQLALHVRCLYSTHNQNESLQNHTSRGSDGAKAQLKKIFSWQFIYCVKFWVKLLIAGNQHGHSSGSTQGEDPFKLLIYPVVQTIIGVFSAVKQPTQKYFPFYLICIRMLNELSEGTDTFIPTCSYILQVFDTLLLRLSIILDYRIYE